MIRLAWAAESVPEKIRQLPRDERRTARAAYDFFMDSEESAYSDFVEKHERFLQREGKKAPEQRRKRPLQFLETPGLENALWPNLYWTETMCETSIRASDIRRQRRRSAADPAQEVGGPRPEHAAEDSGSEEEEGGEDGGRQSIKKSFMKKVLGPIAGYAEDFELLQFIYDLSLWSRIGGGKNACKRIPLRLVLKGETFSPLYFKTRHAALIDLQRQCGHPQIFKTMAPWEPSFPYHYWILNEMAAARRVHGGGRAGAGAGGTGDAASRPHFHRAGARPVHRHEQARRHRPERRLEDPPPWPDRQRPETSQAFFFRLEYQDGKRKAATQAYHGSGRVHCHSLNYLRGPKRAKLEEKIRATEPAEEEAALRGYVLGRPRREGAPTGWPIQEEESHWDNAQLLRLKHTAEDAAVGHRAYFPDTLEITKCHQDGLLGNDRGPLLKYCATYTPKFSDAFQKEWLADEASAFSVARRVLFDYKPCKPEMWLYLAAKTFPPCRYSGTMEELRAPWPGMKVEAVPKIAQLYRSGRGFCKFIASVGINRCGRAGPCSFHRECSA